MSSWHILADIIREEYVLSGTKPINVLKNKNIISRKIEIIQSKKSNLTPGLV